MKKINEFFIKRPLCFCVVIGMCMNLLIEIFNRKSIFAGIAFIFQSPIIFAYNTAIIVATLSIMLLFKRRIFVTLIVSIMWLILGISNFVVRSYRTTPLAAIDFQILRSSFDIIGIYVTIIQLIMIALAVALVVFILVLVYKKSPVRKVNYKKSILIVAVMWCSVGMITFLFIKTGMLQDKFENLSDAYKKNGFVYCFASSLFDNGIEKPVDYSETSVSDILNEISTIKDSEPEKKPNIIFLQLESFIDPNEVNFMSFSTNPVPNFTELKRKYASGYMTVPMVGAGTANIEFEVMTGMSLKYFGASEYPYKTILKEKTCESIPYILRDYGYKSRVIHNHTGSFYDRNEVFSKLGYDGFTSVEYLQNVERNPINWAKDKILTDQVMNTINKTKERDFIYAISVQGHGKYPDEPIEFEHHVNLGISKNQELFSKYDYYVNQLYEMDQFVKTMTDAVMEFEEPTVLVIYGDHLPAIELASEDMNSGSLFKTEYCILANYDLPIPLKYDLNFKSYQIGSQVLEGLGFKNGLMNKLHQMHFNSEKEDKYMEMLQYDMLYGDEVSYSTTGEYEPTELKMGIEDIKITGITMSDEGTTIIGENFTTYSEVYVNDRHISEEILDDKNIILHHKFVNPDDIITIKQVSSDRTVLSESDYFIVE